LRWIKASAATAEQGAAMMTWNRKQRPARHFPAKDVHDLVLSPAEKAGERSAAAVWPTGLAHLWLKRAPNAITLPHRKPARDRDR
jgi:hypothetical protein